MTKLIIKKRPSTIGTFYNAFKTKKHKVSSVGKISAIEGVWDNIRLRENHVKKFNRMCGLKDIEFLNILYPFTMTYPLNLYLISNKELHVPMFKMLTIRNTTVMLRGIKSNERLLLTSKSDGYNIIKNGMEFYMDSKIQSSGETVWENRSTFFIPVKNQEADKSYKPFRLKQIPGAKVVKKWLLPAKNGFRFAKVMGDSNAIHFSKRYAKKLGFKRDFAQPVLVSSKVVEDLPEISGDGPLKLDLFFKGQLYYNSELTLKNVSENRSRRFDIYCQGNDRPCISGKLERV
jgi:hypothetical protein